MPSKVTVPEGVRGQIVLSFCQVTLRKTSAGAGEVLGHSRRAALWAPLPPALPRLSREASKDRVWLAAS